MCRLLFLKSKEKQNLEPHLQALAKIAERSKRWQGDGWGIAYKDLADKWQFYKSLKPMWEDQGSFKKLPQVRFALAHARGAFESGSINLINNHPFKKGKWVFAFNGNIRGVTLKVPGSIGAKRIFNLLLENLKTLDPEKAIRKTVLNIENNSKYIMAFNLVLTDGEKTYVYCHYGERKSYFAIRYYQSDNLNMVCSESYRPYRFKVMNNRELLSL